MADFKPVVSSNIHSAAYDTAAKKITVRFLNHSQYRYPSCSAKEWTDFEKTFDGKQGRSAGKWLSAHLRAKAYERLDDWK